MSSRWRHAAAPREHRHEVHVAYQVSGAAASRTRSCSATSIFNNTSADGPSRRAVDIIHVKAMKARLPGGSAARRGLPGESDYLHFLDLPFYEKAARSIAGQPETSRSRPGSWKNPAAPNLRGGRSGRSSRHAPDLPRNPDAGAAKEQPRTVVCGLRGVALSRRVGEWPIHEVDMAVPLGPPKWRASSAPSSSTKPEASDAVFWRRRPRPAQRAEDSRAPRAVCSTRSASDYEAIETFTGG